MEQKERPTPLAELEKLKAAWTAKHAEAKAELARLEAETGRRLLAGDPGDFRQSVAEARAAVGEAEMILAEIERQLPTAKAVDLQEQARQLRAQADKLQAEAGRIEAEIAPHLDAIQAVQGCRYVPPPPQSRFGWPPAKADELMQRAGRLEDQAGHLEGIAEDVLRKAQEPKRKAVLAGWQV